MNPVELHIAEAGGTSDVVVTIANDVSVADVFDALNLPSDTMVDGASIDSPATTSAVDVLHAGSELNVRPSSGPAAPSAVGFVDVAVVAGLDAGAAARLGSGMFHLSLTSNGSEDGWVVQVDHRELTLSNPQPWQQHGISAEVITNKADLVLAISRPVDPEPSLSSTLHRPPRQRSGQAVAPVQIADVPAAVRQPAPLSWATLLAPIPIALMMALFFRPLFALFAAMGPVMALGRWWESRRRYERSIADRNRTIGALRQHVQHQIQAQVEIASQHRWSDNPHVGVLWQRAVSSSVRLWERRAGDQDFMRATIGVGPARHRVELVEQSCPDEFRDLIDPSAEMRSVPHLVDLALSTALGICGTRSHTLAVTRSLVMQLATTHGPSDLRIGLLCDQHTPSDWDWLKWLPHLNDDLVAHTANELVAKLSVFERKGGLGTAPSNGDLGGLVQLVVIDAPGADVAALVRASSEAEVAMRWVALAPEPTGLPAVCSVVAQITGHEVLMSGGDQLDSPGVVVPTGISTETAHAWARQLAKRVDPEATDLAIGSNEAVSFLDLIGHAAGSDLSSRWAERPVDAPPIVALGMGSVGPFRLDLSVDGPHVLIAGTTGSGKSELLRTLVVGLATECSPKHLNIVLVDFKGGGAFDVVRDLPHVVGMITDLDEVLVARALVSLRAELERRERLFRELGVSTFAQAVVASQVPASRDAASPEGLARLVVVIDEFAALATDYGELMSSIIDLAARGRSLGMHLVLATQRPSGVVDQKIRANTNTRIALRVQDAFDSQDVVGTPDAAHLDRRKPGSAIVRIGGDHPLRVQMVFTGAVDNQEERCVIRPHRLFHETVAAIPDKPLADGNSETELQLLVRSIMQAAAGLDSPARPLWAPPLPEHLDWIDLGARELAAPLPPAGVALGLADIPERQMQLPWRWDPSTGALGIYGASGPCAAKALVSLGVAIASAATPDALHLYVVDGDAGQSSVLASLPHTGAWIRSDETDRVDRVIKLLESALASRRSTQSADQPRIVLLIDNLAAVLAAYDDVHGSDLTDRLAAVARDGSSLGVHIAVTARTPRDISHRLAQQIPNRLVMDLADPSGFLALGLRLRDVAPLPALRAMDVRTRHVVQLVEPPDLSSLASESASAQRIAPPVHTFPDAVAMHELAPAHIDPDGTVRVPVGVESSELGQATLVLQPGQHALVVGAPGLGRSMAAELIARQLGELEPTVTVVRVDHVPGFATSGTSIDLGRIDADAVDALVSVEQSTVLVIDDAESLSLPMVQALERLVDANNGHVRIIATTTLDAARSVRSWTSKIRGSGVGILIGGAPSDGEIFRVRLGPLPGRGSIPGRANLIMRGQVVGMQLAYLNAAT
jgi:S-DNA-T family DNA segregation ATPase FtsK/SpoIIIE